MYQVDAFAEKVFSGNPAAVIPLNNWLSDRIMQQIALENNLSETAFFTPSPQGFNIRWFTPVTEVDLCGHATLAAAHVIFNHMNFSGKEIQFDSKSGILKVRKRDDMLVLDFPTSKAKEVDIQEAVISAFNVEPVKCIEGQEDLMLIFKNESEILHLKPDFQKLLNIEKRGIIVSASSKEYDFVSRFFAPAVGINEDPVTGSAHAVLVPYWAKELNKKELRAKQLSARGGLLWCTFKDERVEIGGKAVTYMLGRISFQ